MGAYEFIKLVFMNKCVWKLFKIFFVFLNLYNLVAAVNVLSTFTCNDVYTSLKD